MILHTDRYYPTTTLVKQGVVVHDAESGDGASASLLSLLKSKGNFPSSRGPGLFYGAGYHGITDGKGGYIEVADATAGPYSAPPLNQTWWHVCMPGYAKQTREEWKDELSTNHVRGVAKFIVDKWRADGQTWPLAFVFQDMLKKGMHGYTSHYQVSLAWRETTHTDPGPNFPWDILAVEIGNLTQEEEEMNTARLVRQSGFTNVFLVGAGPALAISGELYDSYVAAGLPKVFQDHKPSHRAMCFQSGLDMTDEKQVVPGGPTDRF